MVPASVSLLARSPVDRYSLKYDLIGQGLGDPPKKRKERKKKFQPRLEFVETSSQQK